MPEDVEAGYQGQAAKTTRLPQNAPEDVEEGGRQAAKRRSLPKHAKGNQYRPTALGQAVEDAVWWAMESHDEEIEGGRQKLQQEPKQPRCSCRCAAVACGAAIRVCAWLLHAMIDGMVLASAPSTYVLVATAVPITVCALQDVAAFTVTMARLGSSSRRSLTAAVVAISCAPRPSLLIHPTCLLTMPPPCNARQVRLPHGRAALASALRALLLPGGGQCRAHRRRRRLHVHHPLEPQHLHPSYTLHFAEPSSHRYMGCFEIAPPHTHSRAANACYMLCFSCGAAMAYATDVVAQITASRASARA